MAFRTPAIKNYILATGSYDAACAYVALASTVGTSTAGTELTGGAPAYARVVSNWGAASGGVQTASPAAQNVASGSTVADAEFFSAVTVGTYYDGGSVTSQAFASQGTYQVTPTQTLT